MLVDCGFRNFRTNGSKRWALRCFVWGIKYIQYKRNNSWEKYIEYIKSVPACEFGLFEQVVVKEFAEFAGKYPELEGFWLFAGQETDASIFYELVYEFAFTNSPPAVYYHEFGFGTIEPLVEKREFSMSVDEYTHEYNTWECIVYNLRWGVWFCKLSQYPRQSPVSEYSTSTLRFSISPVNAFFIK